MLYLAATSLLIVLTRSQDQFLEQPQDIDNQVFATLPCGSCIDQGYVYCRLGTNDQVFMTDFRMEDGICCEDEARCGLYINDPRYTCSSDYKDKILKKKVCPYIVPICGGGNETRNMAIDEKVNKTVQIKGLAEGRTCMYRIQSTCGKIKVKHQSMKEVLSELKEKKDDDWNDREKRQIEP